MKKKTELRVAEEEVESRIYLVRGKRVMLDQDLAEMYDVETKRLNEQVVRNRGRFPADFMFQLRQKEWNALRLEFAASRKWGGRRTLPRAFTEQGVAMLSSILNSEVAIAVNIQIIRVFTRMREIANTNRELLLKLESLEKDIEANTDDISQIFSVLQELVNPKPAPRKRIGFAKDH